jgi:hypothetical protein
LRFLNDVINSCDFLCPHKKMTKKTLCVREIKKIISELSRGHVSLTNWTISDTVAAQLVELLGSIDVDSFFYARNDGDGLQRIAEWLSASSVTWLQMCGVVKNEVSVAVNNLPNKLENLDLSNNKMIDDDTIVLARVLCGSTVIKINLSNNRIGDNGAKAIADMLPRSMVTSLNLSDNQIGDVGGSALLDVLTRSKVEFVDMYNNYGMSKNIENEFDEYMDILRLVETSQSKRFKLTVM